MYPTSLGLPVSLSKRSPLGRRLATMCVLLAVIAVPSLPVWAQQQIVTCTTGALPHGDMANPPDLVIYVGPGCTVDGMQGGQPNPNYYFRNVNIFGGGALTFNDVTVHFWAQNILIQRDGSLVAGSRLAPIGAKGGTLTIHLWGPDMGGDAMPNSGSHQKGAKGITCLTTADSGKTFTTDPQCGVPNNIWTSNPPIMMDMAHMNPQTKCAKTTFPDKPLAGSQIIPDCFYQYGPIDYDDGDPAGYFGYKVLALSYGGTLQLFGYKGATYPAATPLPPWNSGVSWVRLAKDLHGSETTIVVDRPLPVDPTSKLPKWGKGDQIVVTSTDYLPGHSEQLTIDSIDPDGKTIHLQGKAIAWPHNGTKYDLNAQGVPASVGPQDDPNLPKGNGRQVDTRAAVALLTRSIRIVSGCDNAGQDFPAPDMTCTNTPGNSYFFGGHTLVRQGFRAFQVEGVEFYQLGQGGRIMHYPVHFHMARQVPRPTLTSQFAGTYIKDSSVWDSMNRWYTIHATQGVELSRNVGYKSIGHGYYLEDGTESQNTLSSNIGILARGAVKQGKGGPPPEDGAQAQNPRQIPGIFAGGYPSPSYDAAAAYTVDFVPYTSDVDHPTIFWITNGWNSFQYNMAVGANVCGVCYWLQPAGNSGVSRWEYWESYASEQRMFQKTTPCKDDRFGKSWICDDYSFAGTTPLARFVGNTCSTAMSSFLSISVTTACRGVVPDPAFPHMDGVDNPKIPPTPYETDITPGDDTDRYYPKIDPGGSRAATSCPATGNCNPVANPLQKCAAGSLAQCMITTLDHYTSSFNWAEQNFSAIWLRPQWYLVSNSAITDVQTGGLTMITGGDYTSSSVIPGYWGVARNDVFIGNTQPNTNYFASNAGPFNQASRDADKKSPTPENFYCEGGGGNPNYCLNRKEGMTMPLNNFAVNQRLYNIYDGPSYEDSNAFLDITTTTLDGCGPGIGAGCSDPVNGQGWMYGAIHGMPKDPTQTDPSKSCYMPNAAIAWKQPNGFFYPPAFHSQNLYFKNVDIRHFVIDPPFKPPTLDGYLHPFTVDPSDLSNRYCSQAFDMFGGYGGGSWSAIDRQTELSDDDGTLTGLISNQIGSNHEVVSVNVEPFFRAPYEDTECASNLNTPPLTSPLTGDGTAISSPYQYVTTVVYPDCATNGKSCGIVCEKDCQTDKPVSVPRWSEDCTAQTCYGVPLWRQFQTGYEQQKKPDPFPFIMMMGAAISQRDTLTVNHGTYYIDTTVSVDSQFAAMSSNPTNQLYNGFTSFANWQDKGPFYVFLLYAKHVPDSDTTSQYKSTVQTYQTFVGMGLATNGVTEDQVATNLTSMIQMDKSNKPFIPKPGAWPSKWTRTYDNAKGILTVTMDFSDQSLDFTATQCQPASFCKKSGNSCGCALAPSDPTSTPSIQAQCKSVCSTWAAKDIDCPDAGCYGFSVDLSKSTTFTDATHIPPPAPDCFPNTTDWNAGFGVSTISKGACMYKSLPQPDFACNGPSH